MPTIPVTRSIALDQVEIEETFVRASGAGGQNIQKVSTSVQLRFDVARSPNLPEGVRARLIALAGRRITKDGVLVITAQRHRTQDRNRQDALQRLVELIQQAAVPPPPLRRATKPTRASRERRLTEKAHRGSAKQLRGRPADD